MSQGILETPADLNEPVDPKDPFAYGWRYVKQVLPDGSEKLTQVPLTLEDVLHPQEEDFRMHNDPHFEDCTYLRIVFKAQLAGTPGAVVLTDCRVAWDAAGKYGHGPDDAVVFNVRAYQDWGTFNVVDEGTRPALIIEITSPSTRSTDLIDKRREYAQQQVPHYVIADIRERSGIRSIIFRDFQLVAGASAYREQPIGASGRVWLPEVGLWLGVENGRLACYQSDGERKGTYIEVDQARIEAERLLKNEAEARAAAEEALKKKSELLDAAEQARAAAEARIRELEELMKRRNGEHNEGT